MTFDQYASEYNMDHKNRGLALIFNQVNFDTEKPRLSSNKDKEALLQTLENLHFEVRIYNDCAYAAIKFYIEEARKEDHSENDCILIAILSHGSYDNIWARDTFYNLESITSSFTAGNCPSLAGKPKLFIVQACRGNQFDGGFMMESRRRTQTDGMASKSYKLPNNSDFLIAHSTVPGYVSWRGSKGSWFIQTLCNELKEKGTQYDIQRLMTDVKRKVAFDFESHNTGDPETDGQKQIPTTTSTLLRTMVFK